MVRKLPHWADLELLKTHIVGTNTFFYKSDLKKKKSRYIRCFPALWHKQMSWLTFLYRGKFQLRKKTRLNGSAELDPRTGTIIIITDEARIKLHGKPWKIRSLVSTYFHELAHLVQTNIRVVTGQYPKKTSFEENFLYERTAERLGYFLAKQHAPNLKFHHGEFRGYLSKYDKNFIRECLAGEMYS